MHLIIRQAGLHGRVVIPCLPLEGCQLIGVCMICTGSARGRWLAVQVLLE
jgi:hypothetical protein